MTCFGGSVHVLGMVTKKKRKKTGGRKPPNRIKERMDELGLNDEDMARKLGTTSTTVYRLRMESGMQLTLPWLRRFAVVLGCQAKDLVENETGEETGTVPVVGYVGAGEEVINFEEPGEIDRVVVESGDLSTQAVIVRGRSMMPRYEPGTLIFYRQSDHVPHDCLGRDCIVQVSDGRTLVKKLRAGPRPGVYTLVSMVAPEIMECEVVWASKVLYWQQP